MRYLMFILLLMATLTASHGGEQDETVAPTVASDSALTAVADSVAMTATGEPDAESMRAQLERHLKEVNALLDKMRILDAQADTADSGMTSTLRRAEGYLAERGARQALAEQVRILANVLRAYAGAQERELAQLRREIEELSKRRQQSQQVPPPAAAPEPPGTPAVPTGISYFEVSEEQSLRQIAALPDVYGDPGMWRLLLNSNPQVAKSGDDGVAKGTVLVVPNLHVSRELDFN